MQIKSLVPTDAGRSNSSCIFLKKLLTMRKNTLKTLIIVLIIMNGCSKDPDMTPMDCAVDGPQLVLVSKTDTNCNLSEGFISVAATGGGEGVYMYSLDGKTYQSSGEFSGLAASNYTVYVKSGNGCTSTLDVQIANINGLNIDVATTDAGCKTSEGSITINGTGGVTPYQFKLNNGPFQTDAFFNGLSIGTYTITAVDANNCQQTQTVAISSGVSFSQTIKDIINTNCAISRCHGGTQSPDFRVFDNIKANAQKIKSLTASGTMPKEGSLTQEEINLIGCWVDDGALNN